MIANCIDQVTIGDLPEGIEDDLKALVLALVNSIPYYRDSDMYQAHRAALSNLLESCLPNDEIEHHPNEGELTVQILYEYDGPYSGYKDAFYHGISMSTAASAVLSQVQAVNSGLNSAWWGNYGVPVLTDAIRQQVSVSLNTDSLTNDLNNNHTKFVPALAASYLAVFQTGYAPTAGAWQAIQNTGQAQQAAVILDKAIAEGQFTDMINPFLSDGGDDTVAAVWFLFNLWITLKSLGYSDIDGAIQNYKNAGLIVPSVVGPASWWNGGYFNWFDPLSGADVKNEASAVIGASMPETEYLIRYNSPTPVILSINEDNGYSQSFCSWGSLAWYQASSGSCFGEGTMVLMSSGVSKPIEAIAIGDEVMTTLGARKVALVEKPKRSGRPLYQINDLPFTVTAAHPFRTAFKEDGPAYAAIDPWALIDGLPTMTERGVVRLEEGLPLLAYRDGYLSGEKVGRIMQITEKPDQDKELVYDVILESWAKDRPAYYVGGPDVFLAVEAETIDPLFDRAISIAIITALDIAVPASRQYLTEPHRELPHILPMLDMNRIEALARKAYCSLCYNEGVSRPSIPGPEYYVYNGEWDPHASLLEYYLIRQHARYIKSGLSAGWRTRNYTNSSGDHLTIGLFDLELVDKPLKADANITIELELLGAQTLAADEPVKVELDAKSGKLIWNLRIDKTVDMGRVISEHPACSLIGRLKCGDRDYGQFKAAISKEEPYVVRADRFIFDSTGTVIGRVCLDIRRMTSSEILKEESRKKQWNTKNEQYYAISVGRQLGHQLSALIEAHSTKV